MSKIFLIGGGPSLKGFDFNQISQYTTMGINKSFKYYPTNFLYMMDLSFYKTILDSKSRMPEDADMLEKFKNFQGKIFTLENCKKYKELPNIVYLKQIKTQTISMDLNEGVFAGNNSGFGALMLSIALGYKEIYLLGYDMKIEGTKSHFHEGYASTNLSALPKRLQRFGSLFNSFAPKIKKLGINVVNLNPQSELNCFEKKTIKEILNG